VSECPPLLKDALFAEVSTFSALDKSLHYLVPRDLQEAAQPGSRVLAPLGRRETTGLILSLSRTPPVISEGVTLRSILAVLDTTPVVLPELIELCRWISTYYFYPLGEVFQTALPSGMATSPKAFYRLAPAGTETIEKEKPSVILDLLAQTAKLSMDEIAKQYTSKSVRRELNALEKRGVIERFFEWQTPQPGPKRIKSVRLVSYPTSPDEITHESFSTLIRLLDDAGGRLPMRAMRHHVKNAPYWVKKMERMGLVEIEESEEIREFTCAQSLPNVEPPQLTDDQQAVFDAVFSRIEHPEFETFLLHGVTGSGKTEIYLRLVEECLRKGRGALILVPEIALSTQMEALFRQRFGALLTTWHSGLPVGAKYDQWREMLSGKKRVVLGVRSAVFTPVPDPGIIIVDEEHDSSYKQDDHLRYNARDVALMRARMLRIPILLGSATPSLQTIHNSRLNRYRTLSLPSRILNRPLPELEVVDMKRESKRNRIISHLLGKTLKETVENGQQALLFLNRRGFATFLLCNVCGCVPDCPSCSVSLTYHQGEDRLRCHYCGWERNVPWRCPDCDNVSLSPHGFGTERVEEEVKLLMPDARIVRIDRDTVSHPKDLVEYLNAIRHHLGDVLIGTQMIAKGHDFPNITLVGIVNADTALQIPDFRAGELTVQVLMQVAGRAGRGTMPGKVIVQTFNPSHYTIEAILKMDYVGFCDLELRSREMLQYPPFSRFLKLLVTASEEKTASRAAYAVADLCRRVSEKLRESDRHVAILGPSPAPIVKLNNRYRWHVYAKAWATQDIQEFTEAVLDQAKEIPILRQVQLWVDRDPIMNM
jgi:primosomal protein N' (replication factor Y) (superfamily II helicase)